MELNLRTIEREKFFLETGQGAASLENELAERQKFDYSDFNEARIEQIRCLIDGLPMPSFSSDRAVIEINYPEENLDLMIGDITRQLPDRIREHYIRNLADLD